MIRVNSQKSTQGFQNEFELLFSQYSTLNEQLLRSVVSRLLSEFTVRSSVLLTALTLKVTETLLKQ